MNNHVTHLAQCATHNKHFINVLYDPFPFNIFFFFLARYKRKAQNWSKNPTILHSALNWLFGNVEELYFDFPEAKQDRKYKDVTANYSNPMIKNHTYVCLEQRVINLVKNTI